MWGRIANITAQIDANFGTTGEEGDGSGSQSQAGESDFSWTATPVGDGVKKEEEEEEEGGGGVGVGSAPSMDDDDDDDQGGWGDDDAFDDELDFGDDDDDEPPPENGGANGLPPPPGKSGVASLKNSGEGNGEAVWTTEDPLRAQAAAEENNGLEPSCADDVDVEGGDDDDEAEGGLLGPRAVTKEEVASPRQCQPQSPPRVDDDDDVDNARNLPDVVTVSAPGKVLVAGGYLVLESPNPGVVLAADGCRFHATVAFRPPHSEGQGGGGGGGVVVVGTSIDASWESIPLDVHSPQFGRVFSYYLSYPPDDDDDDVSLRLQPRSRGGDPNRFVERTLLLALGYLRRRLGAKAFHARLRRDRRGGSGGAGGGGQQRVALAVKLRADNDFYSQVARLRERGLELTPRNLETLEPFLPCPRDESTGKPVVNKTGMGSSAALVASTVGALLRFFGAVTLPAGADDDDDVVPARGANKGSEGTAKEEEEGLRIAHNLSQICHCHAQGKVGSGFDVSSAVYGSHVYTRFSKGVIDEFLEDVASTATGEGDDECGLQLSEALAGQLVGLVNGVEWDCTASPVSLPPGLELLMADVCGGSESPSMARKVLEWKKNKRRTGFMDDYYWKDLKRCNKKVISLLSDKFASRTFLDGLRRDGAMIVSTRTAEQWKKPMPSSWHEFEGSSWDVAMQLLDLRMALLECRQNLKGMGRAADVPVEPDEQKALADATMKLPGVVAAGVPGAGGYDALFVVYVKGPKTDDGRSDKVRDEIVKLWRDMSDDGTDTVVCPLSVRAAGPGSGLCTVKLDW